MNEAALAATLDPPWWRQKRWLVAILLALVTAIGYIDRQALSVTAPLLKAEFGFSNTEYGAIAGIFLIAYAVGQLLTGPLIDRLGTKRALSLAVLWWSIVAILHALGRGFGSFLALRALLGLTEGANLPAAFKAVGEWFPRADRSLASGFIMAGVGLGAIVAPPAVGWLAYHYGWQAAFLVPGA
ncbi:MAG TPA: MFS transporter, partial [Steroidobacteraceae bacterium]|nr:MFS transporter [Steroidobacteraceae bacterium]